MLRKRLLARMSRLHKTYTYDRTVAYEAKPASPWGRTVVFDFTINAASSLVPWPCPGWATSGPHTSNAFSQAMIQTFSSTSFGVAGLPSHFNKPWGDSIIHWSSRTIGWHLTYRPPDLLTVIYSPQFPEGPFEIRTSCTTLSRLPIAVELRCSTMQIFRLHFPTYSCSPNISVDTTSQYLQTLVIMSTLKVCKRQIVPSLGSRCYLLLEGPSLFLPITCSHPH